MINMYSKIITFNDTENFTTNIVCTYRIYNGKYFYNRIMYERPIIEGKVHAVGCKWIDIDRLPLLRRMLREADRL